MILMIRTSFAHDLSVCSELLVVAVMLRCAAVWYIAMARGFVHLVKTLSLNIDKSFDKIQIPLIFGFSTWKFVKFANFKAEV